MVLTMATYEGITPEALAAIIGAAVLLKDLSFYDRFSDLDSLHVRLACIAADSGGALEEWGEQSVYELVEMAFSLITSKR